MWDVSIPTVLCLSPLEAREGSPYSSSAVPRNSVCFLGGLAFSPRDPSTHTVLQLRGPPRLSPCPLSIGAQEVHSSSYVSAHLCRQTHGQLLHRQLFCCFRHLHSSPSFKEPPVGKTPQAGTYCNSSLCDLEGISVPCPKHVLYPCCAPGPQVQGPCGSGAVRRHTPEPLTAGPWAHQPCLCHCRCQGTLSGAVSRPQCGGSPTRPCPTCSCQVPGHLPVSSTLGTAWGSSGQASGRMHTEMPGTQFLSLGLPESPALGDGPGVRL
ncbi:hypothetical protein HJG60_011975 [Phyllostomus discolor]|uniref:Uncharacterized protein n=1 Tax=Phyllostomus discolor TaxID=89673 RepID=A0A834DWJ5_9CHIR|nr:hypothetical protein HJG60_011975 [Phyllostomus discolor]